MGFLDILQQYANAGTAANPAAAEQHFDQVAQDAPHDVLGQGVAEAFRSDQTPPFAQMVSQLFGRSDPQQRAGMLNELVGALGPSVASAIGGGALGGLLHSLGGGGQVSPTQATQLSPQQVQEIAQHAEQRDPSVVDRLGQFYGQHPDLVKTLGSAALTIALAGMANRVRG